MKILNDLIKKIYAEKARRAAKKTTLVSPFTKPTWRDYFKFFDLTDFVMKVDIVKKFIHDNSPREKIKRAPEISLVSFIAWVHHKTLKYTIKKIWEADADTVQNWIKAPRQTVFEEIVFLFVFFIVSETLLSAIEPQQEFADSVDAWAVSKLILFKHTYLERRLKLCYLTSKYAGYASTYGKWFLAEYWCELKPRICGLASDIQKQWPLNVLAFLRYIQPHVAYVHVNICYFIADVGQGCWARIVRLTSIRSRLKNFNFHAWLGEQTRDETKRYALYDIIPALLTLFVLITAYVVFHLTWGQLTPLVKAWVYLIVLFYKM